MKQLNLNNTDYFPMVHFYSMDRMINTYTNVRIVPGDEFRRNGKIFTITSIKEETISSCYTSKYPYARFFYYLKYKVNTNPIELIE